MNSPHQKKSGFGCLAYGCLVAIIIAALGVGGVFLFIRSGMRTALDSYTTDKPAPIPTIPYDSAAVDAARGKVAGLLRLIEDPHAVGEVVLTQADLNGLLLASDWGNRVSATLNGDTVSAGFSFQMAALGSWDRAKLLIGDKLDRYVTGQMQATASVENGKVRVNVKELNLNGHAFDQDSSKFASEWISGAIESPSERISKLITTRVERLWIANSEIHIRVKAVEG